MRAGTPACTEVGVWANAIIACAKGALRVAPRRIMLEYCILFTLLIVLNA